MERHYPRSDVAPQSLADILQADEPMPRLVKRNKKKAKAQRKARRRNR